MLRSALAFAVGVVALVAAQPATPLPPGRLPTAAPLAIHPLDASWSNRFGLPIRNGLARAITSYGGSVIVGGWFTQAGTTHASYVAAWDGSAWHALGIGTPGPVLAFAVLGGHLFAAGQVSYTGGFVAEWDGVAWSTLDTTSTPIRALAVLGGELYAGGDFNSIGGVTASCVARWDGSAWHALGSGITGPFPIVRALAVYGTKLVAAGRFYDLQSVAAWDGATWSGLGPGLQISGGSGTVPADVYALAAMGSDLVAVGKIQFAGATVIGNAARWNGAAWSSLGTISNQFGVGEWAGAPVTGAPVSGAVRPARWNGSSWVDDGSPPASAYALFNDGVSLYFGGVGGLSAPDGFLRYDGATWTPLQQAWAPGMSGLTGGGAPTVYDVIEHEGALYAAGALSMAGAEDHFVGVNRIARWDGVAWSALPPTPSPGSLVYTLSHYDGALVAAGDAWVATLGPGGWTRLGGSLGGATLALAQVGTDLVAAGYLPYFGLNGVARWNGSSWAAVGAGFDVYNNDDIPYAVIGYGGGIVAGGYLTASGSTPLKNLAFWNGTSWGDFAGGADGDVYALTLSGSDLLVGGFFTHVGGVEVHGAARWNGASWVPLGDNAEYVYRFREHGGRLFAVGEFEELDGSDVYGVAEWTGERWSTLGSGVVGEALGLDFVGDELFIGGYFGWANGRPSFNIASLPGISTLGAPAPPRVTRLALAVGPNPSRGAMRFRLSLPNPAHVRLTVRDVSGRTVATLVDEDRGAGTSFVEWTTRAAPGVYLATVESGGERRNLRVIRLD